MFLLIFQIQHLSTNMLHVNFKYSAYGLFTINYVTLIQVSKIVLFENVTNSNYELLNLDCSINVPNSYPVDTIRINGHQSSVFTLKGYYNKIDVLLHFCV